MMRCAYCKKVGARKRKCKDVEISLCDDCASVKPVDCALCKKGIAFEHIHRRHFP